MLKYSLIGRLFAVFPLILLAVFLVLPGIVLADEIEDIPDEKIWEYLELSERDAKNLLRTLIEKFTNEWINLFTSNSFSSEKEAVSTILREAVRGDILNYLLVDAPIEVLWKMIKTAVETTQLVSAGEIKVVIEKFEQETVKRAVNYGLDFLMQKEIRVNPGAIEFKYITNKGTKNKTVFQYLIIFQSLDKKIGRVEVRFYSPNPIEPPKSKGTFGGGGGTPNDLQQNLPPFITTVSGTVEKTDLGTYKWLEGPVINIDFPDKVPDLGIKPASFWERMVLRPIKAEIKQIKFVVNWLTERASETSDKTSDFSNSVSAFTRGVWDKIKSVFSKINPFLPASIVQTQLPEEGEQIVGIEETNENNVEILELAETAEPKPKILTLADVQEQLDDISEAIDLLSRQMADLGIGEEEVPPEIAEIEREMEEITKEITETEETAEIAEDNGLGIVLAVGKKETSFCKKDVDAAPSGNKIIFNEIAWMGGQNSANDEWIELKNISGADVNLGGWQILDKDSRIKIIFGSDDSISGNGFYLLERSGDEAVVGVAADKIYSGALNNEDEALYLFNRDCQLEDEVLASPLWPAGENLFKRTLERKNDFGWQTSENPDGTPKNENSRGFSFSFVAPPQALPAPLSPVTPPPEILITEIQISDASSSDNDFIELYNQETKDIDISGFQLKKKNSAGNESSIRVLSAGSAISARGYFLWLNSDYASTSKISADVISGQTLAKNNSVALFDKDENIIDAFGWGSSTNPFMETAVFSQSPGDSEVLARKWATTTESYVDADNNSQDFELQDSSPGRQNEPKVASGGELPPEIPPVEPPVQKLAENIVISEVQIQEQEFIELYNPTEQVVFMDRWYLSYFSPGRDWNDPYRSRQFPEEAAVPAKNYYLIGVFGYPKENGNPPADWEVLTKNNESYSSGQLGNNSGAIAVFSCDPENASTTDEAENCKIDALAWQKANKDEALKVKEGEPALYFSEGQSLGRKKDGEGNFIDANDNLSDFEISPILSPTNSQGEKGNIYAPDAIVDLAIDAENSKNNAVALTWSAPVDGDTAEERFVYFVYYSRGAEITEEDSVLSATTSGKNILLSDIYYNSVYYFRIKTFDGRNFSPFSNSVSLVIPSAWDNSLWPLWRNNPQQTGKSRLISLAETDKTLIKNLLEGKIINPNGIFYSIAIQNGTQGILAQDLAGEEKWFLPEVGANPVLGPDGTIYALSYEKIIAISPSGALKWELALPSFYSAGQPRINLLVDSQSNIYFSTNFRLDNSNFEPALLSLKDSFDKAEINWIFSLNNREKYGQLEEVTERALGLVSAQLVSAPISGGQGNVYLGYNNSLLALDQEGNKKGERVFPSRCGAYYRPEQCQPFVSNLSLDEENGAIYLLVAGEKDFKNVLDAGSQSCVHGLETENIEDEFFEECSSGLSGPISVFSEENIYFYRVVPGWTGERVAVLYNYNPKFERENWQLRLDQLGARDDILIDSEGNIYLLARDSVIIFNNEGSQIWP